MIYINKYNYLQDETMKGYSFKNFLLTCNIYSQNSIFFLFKYEGNEELNEKQVLCRL